jgi:hypothetical protein
LEKGLWRSFSSVDIENVFVQVRSLMDHVSDLIRDHVPKGDQLPHSFDKLRSSMDKYRSRLSVQLQELVESALWFDHMRGIRNALVHEGGMSLVFGEPGESLHFQVYGKNVKGYISHPALMFNENVVHFERYAALLLANLLGFLDNLGRILRSTDSAPGWVGRARNYSPGFAVLRAWMVQTRQFLESGAIA